MIMASGGNVSSDCLDKFPKLQRYISIVDKATDKVNSRGKTKPERAREVLRDLSFELGLSLKDIEEEGFYDKARDKLRKLLQPILKPLAKVLDSNWKLLKLTGMATLIENHKYDSSTAPDKNHAAEQEMRKARHLPWTSLAEIKNQTFVDEDQAAKICLGNQVTGS